MRFVVPQWFMRCSSPRDLGTGSTWEDQSTAKPVGRPWIRLAVPWARIAGEHENTLDDSRCKAWYALTAYRSNDGLLTINTQAFGLISIPPSPFPSFRRSQPIRAAKAQRAV